MTTIEENNDLYNGLPYYKDDDAQCVYCDDYREKHVVIKNMVKHNICQTCKMDDPDKFARETINQATLQPLTLTEMKKKDNELAMILKAQELS